MNLKEARVRRIVIGMALSGILSAGALPGGEKPKPLMGDFMAGGDLKSYWQVQRDRHQGMLKASGAIK